MNKLPVYKGGDQTKSPFISWINSNLNPPNNKISFLQGGSLSNKSLSQQNYLTTRLYSKWLNQSSISIISPSYTSIYTINATSLLSPWSPHPAPPVNGTDGLQFHPFIKPKESLSVFIPALTS